MINYVLLKLTSHCNYDCSYCYWFRDETVRKFPALLSEPIMDAFAEAMERHITRNRLQEFTCSFHGGEPTLFGIERLRRFLIKLDAVGERTNAKINYAFTTNGALINEDWASFLSAFEVSVAVSIDGPPRVHDGRRVTTKGLPTWEATVNGYLALCRKGLSPSIIAVCNPDADPATVLDHFAKDLGVLFCDILVPDYNHDDNPISISRFYIGLFDHWYDNYSNSGLRIPFINDLMRGLFGLDSQTDTIGNNPLETVCLNPSGFYETNDVLRIAGREKVATRSSVFNSEIADVERDPIWRSVRDASIALCETCSACRYKQACGGGHLAQRWSTAKSYDNVSVYCEDYKAILDHIASKIKDDIDVKIGGEPVLPRDIYVAITEGRASHLFGH